MYRTWQDRRKLKRCVESENKNASKFDQEILISHKLKEDKDHHLPLPIYLSLDIKYPQPTAGQNKVQLYFELQTNEQHQLFTDLSHFLNLYLPKMLENQSID